MNEIKYIILIYCKFLRFISSHLDELIKILKYRSIINFILNKLLNYKSNLKTVIIIIINEFI